ncbi:MAG: ribonuclease H-like domain-containing protein [Methanimicrococcus sp.]|nr:ribonuclease H-like domain-containing protein [Methanimicrococcus sp.]
MLRNSYIQMNGIGKTVEKKIWDFGIQSWDDALEKKTDLPISCAKQKAIEAGIEESESRLKEKDHSFFAEKLPSAEHWRAYSEFCKDVAFVDIETTGLSPGYDTITVVGIYNRKEAKTYVQGIDLDDIVDEFSKYKMLITFNGARFDLPFIKHEFPEICFNHLHMDLMYPLKRIGYSGGLKKIEREIGIVRGDNVKDVDGWEAVRLWRKYRRGDEAALDTLLEYNREDIVNLETIIEKVYPRLIENCKCRE